MYSAGNFIEATPETPFFQLGESKYGKPILDRVVGTHLSIDEAAKCALISMDSVTRHRLIDESDPYFRSIRGKWADQLKKVFNELPEPGYW